MNYSKTLIAFSISAVLMGCAQSEDFTAIPGPSSVVTTIPDPNMGPPVPPAAFPPVLTSTPFLNDQGYPHESGHDMVLVPAGEFIMGLTPEEAEVACEVEIVRGSACGPDYVNYLLTEYPSHQVTLTYDFWIDVYETSNLDYQRCVEAGLCSVDDLVQPDEYEAEAFSPLPVEVRFDAAVTFCEEWRGGRMATEAEWEYAARGTDGRLWPWGMAEAEETEQFMAFHYIAGARSLSMVPVDAFPNGVSPFGIFNMAGNIDEFVSDWYAPYPSGPVVNPIGPGSGDERIVRGGHISHGILLASAFSRQPAQVNLEGSGTNSGGIRCVRDVN